MTRYKTLFGIATAAVSVVTFVGSVVTAGARSDTRDRFERTSEPATTVRLESEGDAATVRPWPHRLWNRLEGLPARYLDPIFRTP
ncbi:hypothetical protein [Natronorubrum aibiense]|uniref:Uncharacterized protein n=1 Tax=Natronorubrum aibiense TaxID=348826 RepID=A0A5P9PA70_9EURY|nr:hypothetical protein [Natronorubrum aibiense]QFU85026.1 hypothetical protein GCU68_21145 [Natronorubrum aibiense]